MTPDESREVHLEAELRALPLHRLDPELDARVLRAARAVLLAPPALGSWQRLQAFWERAVAPVLVAGTVAGYLVWAVQAAGALYR
jgi:hypothetical protein